VTEFFVSYSIYDQVLEEAHTLYRCILSADSKELAKEEAETYVEHVFYSYNENAAQPYSGDESSVLVTVRELDQWLSSLRSSYEELKSAVEQ
jgi:hypothetical protein